MEKTSWLDRAINAILRSRFEPVETILALSAAIHGLWLVFPYWAIGPAAGPISGGSRMLEVGIGIVMWVLASLHLVALTLRKQKLRYNVSFLKFIIWFFLTWIAILATELTSIIWIAYLTIASISGSVYLNIAYRTRQEREREIP